MEIVEIKGLTCSVSFRPRSIASNVFFRWKCIGWKDDQEADDFPWPYRKDGKANQWYRREVQSVRPPSGIALGSLSRIRILAVCCPASHAEPLPPSACPPS